MDKVWGSQAGLSEGEGEGDLLRPGMNVLELVREAIFRWF